jgi:lysophospholipid acyltransferase (LPLAT)-like uncharacterized protein
MKLRNPWLIRVIAIVGATVIRLGMATVRYQIINRDTVPHPADPDRARFIYAFWHESMLGPVRFGARVRVLISKHTDGELIARACRYLGFGVVRGSTNRGGSEALVELWDCSREAHLVFTPDGPRGPRRRVQPGIVFLASRSGLPIVPVGIGFSHARRLKSWDRFAIPRLFSRCVCVIGEAIKVPAEADRDRLELYRQLAEQRMLAATEAAEREVALGKPGLPGPHAARVRQADDVLLADDD